MGEETMKKKKKKSQSEKWDQDEENMTNTWMQEK